jgi:hypothetical protein
MAWRTLKVCEQRARLLARLATRSLSAPSRRHFLIANLELRFNVSYIRINDLKFPNRKFSAVFHPQPERACHKRTRVSPEARGAHLTPPFCWLVTRHSSPVTAFLIETPRLKIRVTSRKQNQSQFLIETNQALSAADSSPHCPPAGARVATSHASLRHHLPAFSASMLESKTR